MYEMITLYDVARVAGVSYQTVSRVINDAEHVSARTGKRSAQQRYICAKAAGRNAPTLGLMTSDLALRSVANRLSCKNPGRLDRGWRTHLRWWSNPRFWCRALCRNYWRSAWSTAEVSVPLEDATAKCFGDRPSLAGDRCIHSSG